MKKRIWTVAAGLAAFAALIAVPAALAAYTSTKLEVTQDGHDHRREGHADPDRRRDRRACAIFAPAGTQLTTNQAPGTVLGTATAIAKALALAGADVPLRGPTRRRGAGAGLRNDTGGMHSKAPRRSQRGSWCSTAAGQPSQFPIVPRRDDGHDCRARPGIHPALPAAAGHPSRLRVAPRSAASSTAPSSPINGVFSAGPARRVDRHLDAVHAGHGTAERRGHHRIAGGDRTRRRDLAAKRSGARRNAHRRRDTGGPGSRRRYRHDLRRIARRPGSSVSARRRSPPTASSRSRPRRERSSAPTRSQRRRSAAALCAQLSRCSAPIPCVNPTVNGFVAKSKVVKKR